LSSQKRSPYRQSPNRFSGNWFELEQVSEADDASSRKEFRYRIGICKRESRETKYWLRLVAKAAPEMAEPARVHWSEAKELHLIFAKIYRGKPTTRPK
jgi:hypothetical protein